MNICYSMGKTCKVCGSLISDNNITGIGCECRYSYQKAKSIVFFDSKERGLEYFNIKVKSWLPVFIREYENVKFRSPFRKQFYPSVVEQYKTKGYVSKKQLEICIDMTVHKITQHEHEEIYDSIEEQQKNILEAFEPNEEEEKKMINLANSFRKEFRENQKKGAF